jgi:hypothetical protein
MTCNRGKLGRSWLDLFHVVAGSVVCGCRLLGRGVCLEWYNRYNLLHQIASYALGFRIQLSISSWVMC